MNELITPIIRSMDFEDLEVVTWIEQQTAITPWNNQLFASCLHLYHSYVAKINAKVVGFGILAKYDQIKEAHILNIGVDPKWQQRGIGSNLLKYLINSCEQMVEKIFLEVRIDNYSAINLYKKFNFKQIGIRKKYYITANSKQDALVFELNC